MSNYWNTLSPIHSLLTKRESHAIGGRAGFGSGKKVDQGGKPVKRIILWKGKAKNWPGAKKAAQQTKNKKAEGGRIGAKDGKWIQKQPLQLKKEAQKENVHRLLKKVVQVVQKLQLRLLKKWLRKGKQHNGKKEKS